MVESEIAKAPDLSLGGGGHGGVLGFSPHPRRYGETMASKCDRLTGNRHFHYNFGYWIQIPTHSKYPLRLERHRLLFDELVLEQDQLLCGCYFYGTLRRRDGARVRSFAES